MGPITPDACHEDVKHISTPVLGESSSGAVDCT